MIEIENITKSYFIQMVREFYSLEQTIDANNYGRVIAPQLRELKQIACEKGWDLNEIHQKIKNTSRKFKVKDKVISGLKSNSVNPLTDELCEALLDQFVNTGIFEIRLLKSKDDIERGLDTASIEDIRRAEKASNKVGLEIFVKNIKNGNLNKVNNYYYNKIMSIGIEKLEEYLKTNKTTDNKLQNFLDEVYNNCYTFDAEHIGSKGLKSSLHFNEDFDKNNEFRMYFNMPRSDEAVNFVKDYQIMCQSLEIDYNMKAFKNMEANNKDVTIFYSSYSDMNLKLEIIKKLMKKYPNIEFGTPPLACAKVAGLSNVGICHMGILDYENGKNLMTYNDYINQLSYLALDEVFGDNLSQISSKTEERIKKSKKGERRRKIRRNKKSSFL